MAAPADDLRARALRLLARREYSRQELAKKLLSKPAPRPMRPSNHGRHGASEAFDTESFSEEVYEPPTEREVDALLDDLEQRKMLSDTRYAEMRTRVRAPRYGDSRLRQELAQKGIDRETIDAVIAEQPGEYARCHEVWLKKFGQQPADMNERAKQTRYLATRGFAMRVIQQVLRGGGCDGSECEQSGEGLDPDPAS